MAIQLFGRWHLSVIQAIHNWENRFRIEGASSGSGTYPPTIGLDVVADGPSWLLVGEYRESSADPWRPAEMMIDAGLDRVDISAEIGSEDPLPSKDFEDIRWAASYLDSTLYEIASRPYAVRPNDFFQMPDGIFEAALGRYYMAVRVTNRWGLPFTSDHVLDITPGSRSDLAMRGIEISDVWSQAELAALGQVQSGTGMVLGPLVPGASKTVYFKVDVSAAAPRKHEVTFVLRNLNGMADPDHPARRIAKQIFVSRTSFEAHSGHIVSEVQEGTLRLRLREIAIDRVTARKRRRRCPPERLRSSGQTELEKLRDALERLLKGERIDICALQEILACACCKERGNGGGRIDPGQFSDGRFCYDPFYAFPTKFSYSVTPRTPYPGQYGPLPYDDPWWKVLLLIVAALLLLAGALVEGADIAYQDEDLVIGTLGRVQRDDVDAALCVLDTDRALSFLQTLDAQNDEEFQAAIVALDGNIDLVGPVMTRAELDAIMMTPVDDPSRRVHKSGARTGLTHGLMAGFAPLGHDLSSWSIDQLTIERDPAFGEPVSRGGDSGSIWVHSATLRPVALHHSGDDADTFGRASLLEDVQSRMNITL